MAAPRMLDRLGLRLRGLPRSPRELDRALRLLAAYRRLGWFASGSQGARTPAGEAIPWWTYAGILWLDSHLRTLPERPDCCLEIGSGTSTQWLAQRFATVISLEHDERWFERLRPTLPDNVDLRLVDADDVEAYLAAFGERQTWDLAVIDGLHRAACLSRSVTQLSDRSLVLLDDSDRPLYADAIRAIHRQGVSRTDFFGFSPGVAHLRCTSFFSRGPLGSSADSPAFLGHGLATYRNL